MVRIHPPQYGTRTVQNVRQRNVTRKGTQHKGSPFSHEGVPLGVPEYRSVRALYADCAGRYLQWRRGSAV